MDCRILIGKLLFFIDDFDASASAWDCGRDNRKGGLLIDWISRLDLLVLNRRFVVILYASAREIMC